MAGVLGHTESRFLRSVLDIMHQMMLLQHRVAIGPTISICHANRLLTKFAQAAVLISRELTITRRAITFKPSASHALWRK